MKLFRPSNIYEESWLLLSVTKFLGLYPIKFFKIKYIYYIYICILIIFYWLMYFYVTYHIYSMFGTFLNINETFILRKIRYYINVFLFPTIIISSMHQSSQIRKALEQINNVDKNMKFFNIQIDHILCMKNDIVRIITAIFVTIISNLIDYYGLLDNDLDSMYVFSWIVDRIPDFLNVIVICSFSVFMNKIEIRFTQINTILNIITKGKCFNSISDAADPNNVFRYKLLKYLRFELCKTISLLNEAYSFRFKVLSIIYIICVCLHICVIYNNTNNRFYAVDVIQSFAWGTIDLIKLVYLIHLYHSLTLEHKKLNK